MIASKIATVTPLVDRSFGWVAEQLGCVIGASTLISMGRNHQLRATVALHCARVKVDAHKSMRSWKLLDTRLQHAAEAR